MRLIQYVFYVNSMWMLMWMEYQPNADILLYYAIVVLLFEKWKNESNKKGDENFRFVVL